MTLVFIYGPPAVGKYTVGKALARLTGYRLFHNHLTADVVEEIIDRGTPSFGRAVRKIRLDLITIAARTPLPGIVFTYVYLHPEDLPEIRRYVALIRRAHGRIVFVKLEAATAVLERRVLHASRRSFGKIRSKALLRRMLTRHDFAPTITGVQTLTIDTAKTTPYQAAERIVRHYRLPRRQRS